MVGRFALGTSVVGSFVENGSPGEWGSRRVISFEGSPLDIQKSCCKKDVL